ncbi:MAG: hypothetical protein ACMXYL_00280 [Candidatus Woesearchaeota archaeon]
MMTTRKKSRTISKTKSRKRTVANKKDQDITIALRKLHKDMEDSLKRMESLIGKIEDDKAKPKIKKAITRFHKKQKEQLTKVVKTTKK